MIKELLKKYLITKSNKYVAIYGSIYYFNKRKEDNGINLITLIDKLSFSVQHKSYRERIPLQVANLGSKTINTVSSKIKYFGILCAKKETVAGQKRAMSCSVIDRIRITGQQNFDKSKTLNPVEIKTDRNQTLKTLQRYQKNYKFRYGSMKQKFCSLHVMVQTIHVML